MRSKWAETDAAQVLEDEARLAGVFESVPESSTQRPPLKNGTMLSVRPTVWMAQLANRHTRASNPNRM